MWSLALLCLVVVYGVVCVVLHYCGYLLFFHGRQHRQHRDQTQLCDFRTAMLVVAHPDDECMFFGPTLLKLKSYAVNDNQPRRIYLLCMSSGNYRGLAKIRKVELVGSCRRLGLDSSNITIISHTDLPDDSSKHWEKRLVARIILRYVDMWDVDTIITFGRRGVSGHRNHRAIYAAVRHLCFVKQLPSRCQAFVLDDVNILRKYIGILDVPFTHLISNNVYVSGPIEIAQTKEAMAAHRSQMVWYRRLYCAFSRYIVVNSLTDVQQVIDFDDSDDDSNYSAR